MQVSFLLLFIAIAMVLLIFPVFIILLLFITTIAIVNGTSISKRVARDYELLDGFSQSITVTKVLGIRALHIGHIQYNILWVKQKVLT